MGEKLTLARYLQGRGEVKALTHIEAQAFGVPYPLQPGWPTRHGEIEITEAMIDDLKTRIATAKGSTASKARRGLAGIGFIVQAAASTDSTPLNRVRPATPIAPASRAVPARSKAFPGFVLRQARRYRSRSSAPWA
jgi:hypothetical protein